MPTTDEFTRGWELQQAGDLRAAEDVYRRILRADSRQARVWFALGQLCQADQRPVEAIACFRQGVELEPREAEGYVLLGNVLLQQRQHAEAEVAFRRCLELKPDHVTALGNLGFILGELDRRDEAKACYEKALQLRPDLAELHHNLGNVLREQHQFDAALASYQKALQLRPEYGKAHINRGIALVALGRIDEAINHLERGVQLRPDLADAHSSLGAALAVQQRFDEAIARYEHALKLKPDYAEAAWNRSLVWLLCGDYEQGWPAFEARWRCERPEKLPAFTQPRWDGSPLQGRTIVLCAEQGLGDTIHFVRYAAMVKERGGRVILNCQGSLIKLLTRTPGIDGMVAWGAQPPKFDVWLPLLSVPAVFRTTVATIPAPIPYIRPDPDLVAHWKRQLSPVRAFRVGIAWQGSPRHAWDRLRSVTLDAFEPLARIPGVRLISLQKNLGSEQVRAAQGRVPVLSLGECLDEDAGPFMDTAAILANLDLVITIDTAVAHLAGAMGVPAWLALNYSADWRWLLKRDDSPWYPTVRLFRQPKLGDWASVFRQIADSLATKVAGYQPKRPIYLEATPGELLDRIAELEAAPELDDAARAELADLNQMRRDAIEPSDEVAELAEQLEVIHVRIRTLDIELLGCEHAKDDGVGFVEAFREFRQLQRRRADIKQSISSILPVCRRR
jgi:tetratricopeptide (TPR) repeat protein